MKLAKLIFASHLDEDEKIIEVIHRHVFVILRDSWKMIFFGFIAPVLFYLLFPQFIVLSIVWFFGGIVGFIDHLTDWYFDAWIITNTGVIDIDRRGPFDRTSTRIEYHMIEGVSYTIRGVWATLLNFGEITIDKLGAQTSVVLTDAPNPKKVERKIMKYQEDYVMERSFRDHNALKGMLSDMIAYHVQTNKIKIPKRK